MTPKWVAVCELLEFFVLKLSHLISNSVFTYLSLAEVASDRFAHRHLAVAWLCIVADNSVVKQVHVRTPCLHAEAKKEMGNSFLMDDSLV